MRKLTSLVLTTTCVAKVGALEDVALCALSTLMAIAKETKSIANRGI
jgi:hypothetical protein